MVNRNFLTLSTMTSPSQKFPNNRYSFSDELCRLSYLFSVTDISQGTPTIWQKSKILIQNLNFFSSPPPSKHELRIQRISTKLVIFFFILLMAVVLTYTLFITNMTTIIILSPSLTIYLELSLKSLSSRTLKCPCSRGSINYDKLFHAKYSLHQVCSSIFVDQRWIDYLATQHEMDTLLHEDFRWTGSSAFQALKTLCVSSNRMIHDCFIRFFSNQYISIAVIPPALFQAETRALADLFRLSMANSFQWSFSMIRDVTQANALLSGLLTN